MNYLRDWCQALTPNGGWLSAIWSGLCYWTREIRRLAVPILLIGLFWYWGQTVDKHDEIRRALWAVALAGIGLIAGHAWRSEVFYYLSYGEAWLSGVSYVRDNLNSTNAGKSAAAAKLLGDMIRGASILIGIIIGATMYVVGVGL